DRRCHHDPAPDSDIEEPAGKRYRVGLGRAVVAKCGARCESLPGNVFLAEQRSPDAGHFAEPMFLAERGRVERRSGQVEAMAWMEVAGKAKGRDNGGDAGDGRARASVDASRSSEAKALLELEHGSVDLPLDERRA